jgi:hypothetical protein
MIAEPIRVNDEDALSRRFHRDHVRRNGTLSSAVFKKRGTPDTEISVDVARLTTVEETIARANAPGVFGVAQLLARIPRSLSFDVRHAPLHEDYAHALIVGENDDERCARMSEACVVVRRL